MEKDKKAIAIFNAFGYPDKNCRNKYLFTHELALALNQFCKTEVFDLGADPSTFKSVVIDFYDGLKVYRFPKMLRKYFDILKHYKIIMNYRKTVKQTVARENYDFILLSFIDIRFLLFINSIRNKKTKIAVITHGSDALILWDNFFNRFLKKMLLKKVDYILPVSDFTEIMVKTAVNVSLYPKIKKIYNGINKKKFENIYQVTKEDVKNKLSFNSKPILLTVSNLVKRKGIDIAIKADLILKEKGISFLHIIIGTGEEEDDLKKLVATSGLGRNVIFIDRINNDYELMEYFKAADVFIMLSKTDYKKQKTEGFGIVLAEAGYIGLPVIAGNSGGISTVVKHGFTGYLINTDESEPEKEAAYYLEKLFFDNELYSQISRNANKFIDDNFDWMANANKILRLIDLKNLY